MACLFRVAEDATLGRVLRSTRDIPAGQIVLEEDPLIVFDYSDEIILPHPWQSEIQTWRQKYVSIIQIDHIGNSCAAFLSSADSELKQTWLSWFQNSTNGPADNAVRELARNLCNLSNETKVDPDELARALLACLINNHSYQKANAALFKYGSMAVHSCSPNTSFKTSSGRLVMRALSKIKAGDLLSISYLSWEDLTKPTMLRRNKLFGSRHFVCNCSRCTGPDTTRVLPCPTIDCTGSICILQRNMNDPPRWNCDSGNVACEFKADLGLEIRPALGSRIERIFEKEKLLLNQWSDKSMIEKVLIKPDPSSITNWLEKLAAGTCGKKHWLYADNLNHSVSMLFDYSMLKSDESAVHLGFSNQMAYFEWTREVFADMPDGTPYSTSAIRTVNEFYQYERWNASFFSPYGPLLLKAIQLVHSIEPGVRCEWGNDDEDAGKLRHIMVSYCARCGVRGSLKCSACKRVAYCSKAHQKSDWKTHKAFCPCLLART